MIFKKKYIFSTEQSRLLTEVQENNCFEHLWIFHGKHIRDHSFGRYAKSSKKLNPLIRTPLWRNFSIKQIFNNKRKRFSIKFTYVLNEWVSLRIQSECGKTRTRKNSVFGHFSRSKISIQKQSPVSVLQNRFSEKAWRTIAYFIKKTDVSAGRLPESFAKLSKSVLNRCFYMKLFWKYTANMPKCDFIKVAKQLYRNHSSTRVFCRKVAEYFQNIFSWETFKRLLLFFLLLFFFIWIFMLFRKSASECHAKAFSLVPILDT